MHNRVFVLILFSIVSSIAWGSIKSDIIFLKQENTIYLEEVLLIKAKLKSYTHNNSDSLEAEVDFLISRYYEEVNQMDSSLVYALRAIGNIEKHWDLAAYAYSSAAIGYYATNKYELAQAYFDTAVAVTQKLNSLMLLTELYSNMAVMYSELHDREREIEYLQKGLLLADSIKYAEQQASIRVNLSIAYNESNLVNEGLTVLHEAINLANKILDDDQKRRILAYSYGNLGDFYGQLKKFDTSNVYLEKALENIDSSDSIMRAFTINSIGLNHLDNNQYDEAFLKLQFAHSIFSKTNDNVAKIATAISYSDALYYTKQYDEAKKICLEGIALATQTNDFDGFEGLYSTLGRVYIALNQDEKAIDAFNKASIYKDSARIRFLDEETAQMKVELDLVKKELENESLRKINDQNTKTISKSYTFIILIALISLLLLVLLVFTYTNHKRIKYQKNELSINNKILQESIQNNKRLISLISHDIRGPIGSLEQLLNLYQQNKSLNHEEVITLSKDSLASMNTLIGGLLNWARNKRGLTRVNAAVLNVSQEIKHIEKLYKHQLMMKNITINVQVNKYETVFADENMLLTILRNVITNAIKFTHKDGKICISFLQEANYDVISITDNGTGLSTEELEKLRNWSINSKKGTNSELGTGLGILLVKDMMEAHSGKLTINSKLGKGSTFSMYFPRKA